MIHLTTKVFIFSIFSLVYEIYREIHSIAALILSSKETYCAKAIIWLNISMV